MVSPVEQIDDLAHIEKELEDLQALIKQHFGTVADLTEIQPQLSMLHQFQDNYQTASHKTETTLARIEQVQKRLSDRVDSLENRFQKISENSASLTQTLEQVLGQCAAEWTQQQEAMQAYLREFEARVQNDVNHAINRLGKNGVDSMAQRERLEKLDTRVRSLSSAVKGINSTLKTWSGLAILISGVGFLGIVVLMIFI